MSKPLLPIGTFIAHIFRQFARDWNAMFLISAWFLFGPLLMLAAALVERQSPAFGQFLAAVFAIVSIATTLWTTIRLMRWTLWKDAGQPVQKDEAKTAWMFFWPMLWIIVLESLAVLGGLVAFIFPGIWIAILLTTSRYLFLEDGVRGTQALSASAALVSGRWWATFWRVVIPGCVFLFVLTISFTLLTTVIGLIAGSAKIDALITGTQPIANAFQAVLQGITQAIFMPLFIIWQVKLVHALKESR